MIQYRLIAYNTKASAEAQESDISKGQSQNKNTASRAASLVQGVVNAPNNDPYIAVLRTLWSGLNTAMYGSLFGAFTTP